MAISLHQQNQSGIVDSLNTENVTNKLTMKLEQNNT
jgi:hypothetical protein